MVEQRIENPRVGSSSLPPGTLNIVVNTAVGKGFTDFEPTPNISFEDIIDRENC